MYRCPGRVANFSFFFGFEQEKRSTIGHYFGNCGKKQWPWQPKFYVTQSIPLKSIAKNKVLKKTNENKKKKGKKRFKIFISIKLPEDFMPLGFLTS